MFCQIKLPTKQITTAIDLSSIDVIEVGKDPDLESDERLFILFYKANSESPAIKINCSKLKGDEIMDLYDWLCEVKRNESGVPTTFIASMLKA